ncbi:cation:proton antiporter [Sandaracinus amylolyticus]|uniref:TrkA-N Sodium/hydrogen exchanger n=1 Tax=Sandaracinus amylolyticus TaxID=927083 RepID=A0A0F6YFP3_9BACT|nr:cation:proton antiporter [Sandaracinus amylolyticus]AKF03828.1 TrkA-N Sodium/hydrogen exchanger [Sandaracinus amylolyticus]
MPPHSDLIITLAGALTAALVFGLAARRLGLSPIVGYLVAGVVVGPFTGGVVVDRAIAEQLAELGVVVLMFGVGLHFGVKDLLAARFVALPGALIQVAVATLLGAAVAWASGWSLGAGVVLGIAISVASTVLLTRVLADHDALHTDAGRIAVGWLLVEDLLTVLVLVVLPVVTERDARGASDLVLALGAAAIKVTLLVAFTALAGRRLIPALLERVARMRSRELFTLSVLVLALGIAVGSSLVFGASFALGAFLAGMVVGQSEASARAASEALPMRDAFAVLFFVSVGMLFEPSAVLANLPLTLAVAAIVLVAKPLTAYAVVRVLRAPHRTALVIALALAQIGEFSFVLIALANDLGVVPREATQVVVATSLISITLCPIAFRVFAGGRLGGSGEHADRRAVIAGQGAVGVAVTRMLRERGVEPTVIDLDQRVVRALQREGIHAVHGDASKREILERAGVPAASVVVVTVASAEAEAVLESARLLTPDGTVLVRLSDLADAPGARAAGAGVIDVDHAHAAREMTARVLALLGTPTTRHASTAARQVDVAPPRDPVGTS